VVWVARFFVLWHLNPTAPWPTDPSKYLELEEKLWAGVDGLMKKGEFEEFGVFPDAHFGYVIGKGETVDVYRDICMFYPYIVCEVHEIISLEKHKEILRAVLKAQIAAMKK
jgi:hypothetical protein